MDILGEGEEGYESKRYVDLLSDYWSTLENI